MDAILEKIKETKVGKIISDIKEFELGRKNNFNLIDFRVSSKSYRTIKIKNKLKIEPEYSGKITEAAILIKIGENTGYYIVYNKDKNPCLEIHSVMFIGLDYYLIKQDNIKERLTLNELKSELEKVKLFTKKESEKIKEQTSILKLPISKTEINELRGRVMFESVKGLLMVNEEKFSDNDIKTLENFKSVYYNIIKEQRLYNIFEAFKSIDKVIIEKATNKLFLHKLIKNLHNINSISSELLQSKNISNELKLLVGTIGEEKVIKILKSINE